MDPERLQRILSSHPSQPQNGSTVPFFTEEAPFIVNATYLEELRSELTPILKQHCALGNEPTAPNSEEDAMLKRQEKFGTLQGPATTAGGPAVDDADRVAKRESKFGTATPVAVNSDDRVAARLAKFGAPPPPPVPVNSDERVAARAAKFGAK
eukprot:PhF_6_TR4055/c0_g1_i1/m.5553